VQSVLELLSQITLRPAQMPANNYQIRAIAFRMAAHSALWSEPLIILKCWLGPVVAVWGLCSEVSSAAVFKPQQRVVRYAGTPWHQITVKNGTLVDLVAGLVTKTRLGLMSLHVVDF